MNSGTCSPPRRSAWGSRGSGSARWRSSATAAGSGWRPTPGRSGTSCSRTCCPPPERFAAAVLGGPVADLVVGAACLLAAALVNPGPPAHLPPHPRGEWRKVALLFPGDPVTAHLNVAGVLSVSLGLRSLVPGRTAAGWRTDGGLLLDLWRQSGPARREFVRTGGPATHEVVVLDSPDHNYLYVIALLEDVCGLTRRAACELAVRIDKTGRAAVFAGSPADCERVRAGIHAAGPGPALERSAGPLRAEIVPAGDGESYARTA